jgi:hypothetical protein
MNLAKFSQLIPWKEGSRNIISIGSRITSIKLLLRYQASYQHTASRARRYQTCRRPQPTCAMQVCLTCMSMVLGLSCKATIAADSRVSAGLPASYVCDAVRWGRSLVHVGIPSM